MNQSEASQKPPSEGTFQLDNFSDTETKMENSQRKGSLAWEILFVSVICSAQLMTQAGLALSIVPMHIIGDSFGIDSPGQLSWFSAGYSLTVGTFILIAGRLGDTFGHKKLFIGGFIWYALWCVIGGLSVYSNQYLFDISRAMQGIGPAFLLPNAIAIIGRTYAHADRKQEMIFALFGATAPGGFVLGAVFSSLLSGAIGWQWAYWIMAIALALLALLSMFVLPPTSQDADEMDEAEEASPMWKRLDLFGSVTGVAALVLINFAFNQGASVGWEAPYIGTTLGLGLLILGLFIFIELRGTYPLVPFRFLRRESIFSLVCIAAGWASFGVFVLYLWNTCLVLRQQSPLQTSAQFAVVAISGLCASITTGLLISRVKVSSLMLISMLAFMIGGILFATMPVEQTYWAQMFVGLIILPWGMDMSFPAGVIVLSRSMPKQHQGVAASLINTVVNYSISIGLGVAGTVEIYVDRAGATPYKGFQSANFTGVGFAALGVAIALLWRLTQCSSSTGGSSRRRRRRKSGDSKERNGNTDEKIRSVDAGTAAAAGGERV